VNIVTQLKAMDRLSEGTSRAMDSIKRVVSRNTQLNMQVGKGAVTPKKVYRFPSPASQPLPTLVGTEETAVNLHLNNDWVHQPKYGMFFE
jgi:hypothetical protein